MNIIVGNAWPYANGALHIGRVSSWLPGDVIARYHRAKGDNVVFISGSDCHGELVLKKANILKRSPKDVSTHFHKVFKKNFEDLNFSFDSFTKTDSEYHSENVKDFIKKLYDSGFIYEKKVEENFCDICNKEVLERFIKNGIHIDCGKEINKRIVDKLFFKLSTAKEYLDGLINKDLYWRENAISLSKRYLNEGLRDKAINREIDWGIDIPIDGFIDQKVYVWIEAVMAYITASKNCIENKDEDFNSYWNDENSRVYLLHGKDNIPFHTITLPAIIYSLGYEKCNLRILSSEHMNLEGKKFSTNRNWVVWLDDLLKKYNSDTIRYYLLTHGAEERDSNFTFRDFINTHNNDLLGVYGNFINRTLSFIEKYYDGKLLRQRINIALDLNITKTYELCGREIEKGNLKLVIDEILKLTIKGNDYFDNEKPWILFRNNPDRCKEVIYNCGRLVLNLANLLNPIIPDTAQKIRSLFGVNSISFNTLDLDEFNIGKVELLFERIDKKKISEEIYKLKSKKK